jgi:hypothetical protein
MQLQLGINTCFAVKRWPRPDDWAPIVCNRLSLSLVQHSLDLVDLAECDSYASGIQELVDTANAYKLTLHSTFTGLVAYSANLLLHPNRSKRNSARRWFGRVIRYSAQIGANATGGHIGAFSVEDWRNPERRRVIWAHLRASLAVLASDARQAGLHYLLIENLAAAREPSTIAMVQELLTEGDDNHVPIRLCLDVGHMCVPGTDAVDRDPYAWLHQLGPVAPVIHIQQSDSEADHHWPFTTERNRQGRIDADQVIDALGEGGVEQSVLILEVIPPFEQDDNMVLDDLAASSEYWLEALSRQGVLSSAHE